MRTTLLLLTCLHMLALTVYSQPSKRKRLPQSSYLYQVTTRDKETGQKRIGFIDKAGKLVIGFDRLPTTTVFVSEFYEGLAVIVLKENDQQDLAAGYIDETGTVKIALRFKYAWNFSEGLAYVETETTKGFINRSGTLVIKLTEESSSEFHEGFAAVSTAQEWGFIDRSGKRLTSERFKRVERFSEGLAAVAVGYGQSARFGFINKKGKMVIPPRFEPILGHHNVISSLSHFSEGLAKVKVGERRYGYINKKGDFVIPPRFRDADDFSEGLASVTTESGQSGYIDKAGHWVIVLRSAGGYAFNEGLAPVAFTSERGTKVGYIDRTGKVVIEPLFDNALEFENGVAAVSIDRMVQSVSGRVLESQRGYINKAGEYLWKPQ